MRWRVGTLMLVVALVALGMAFVLQARRLHTVQSEYKLSIQRECIHIDMVHSLVNKQMRLRREIE